MEIVYRKLADLRPNPKNPRRVEPEAVAALAESIKANPQFFEARPVLLSDRTGALVIIAGERRSEAGRLLKMEKVPTILLSGLTEEQEDEIMVRDNTHAGKWDVIKLIKQWGGDDLKTWGVEDTFTHAHNWDNFARVSDEDAPEDPVLFFRITIKVPGTFSAEKDNIISSVKELLSRYEGVQIGRQK